MTREEVKDYVDNNIDRMAREFGLGDWRIKLDFPKGYDRTDNFQVAGKCHSDFKRQRALIEIWADSFEDRPEQELRETVEHELLHLCHAGLLDSVDTAFAMLDEDQKPVFDRALMLGYELTVRSLEKLVAALRASNQNPPTEQPEPSPSQLDSQPPTISVDQPASV